ncbi:MAG: ribosome silencing factor [Chitinophagales bacterium]|nr:ribosome silencing factor [Chitinophagales bacterium]
MKKKVATANILRNAVVDAILDKKGNDVVSLDLSEVSEAISDYFIICHGDSSTQVQAIADHIRDKIKKDYKQVPAFVEGYNNLEWILLDYIDIVVHVFHREARLKYQLEELWNDATVYKHDSIQKIV